MADSKSPAEVEDTVPKILEFDGPGGPVRIEVAPAGDEIEAVGRAREIVQTVEANIESVLAMAGRIATAFASALRTAPVETAAIEFGLQFTAKGNLYVVESEGQAAMKVTLTLRPDAAPVAGGSEPT